MEFVERLTKAEITTFRADRKPDYYPYIAVRFESFLKEFGGTGFERRKTSKSGHAS